MIEHLLNKKRIAFVDDELFFARAYVEAIEDAYSVIAIEDAGHALEMIESDPEIRAVIVDVMMPVPFGVSPEEVHDGLDTGLWLIKKLAPTLTERRVPVIILTSRSKSSVQKMIHDLGVPPSLISLKTKIETPPGALRYFLDQAMKEAASE